MKRVLITGSTGQLGQSLQGLSGLTEGFHCDFVDRSLLDISDADAVERYFKLNTYDIVVNTAAYTAVDKAEDDVLTCEAVNHLAVQYLVDACREAGTWFIHISSDYVYHPNHSAIMDENEACNPQGVYARTKLAGDLYALDYEKSIILRTSWVFSPYGHNFVKTMDRLTKEREALSIVDDQIGSPTYAPDLAEWILAFIRCIDEQQVAGIHGLYHACNNGYTSWHGFASEILALNGAKCTLEPVPSSSYPTRAKRPLNSRLSCAKIQASLGIEIRSWQEALGDYFGG